MTPMKPVRIIDLIGKPVDGIKIDARTVLPSGDLMYPEICKEPRPWTLASVTIERKKDGKWLYWRFHELHFGCNYSGVRMDRHNVSDYCLMMPEDFAA